VDESEGVSDDQQTNLVAEMVAESFFDRRLQAMKVRKGCFGTLWLV